MSVKVEVAKEKRIGQARAATVHAKANFTDLKLILGRTERGRQVC
jgi:hypothetical protein